MSCWSVKWSSGTASMNLDSQWSKHKACFPHAKQVWLAVNHSYFITTVNWNHCLKWIAHADEFSYMSIICLYVMRLWTVAKIYIWALTCDFQQCGTLTSVDSDEPVQPSFKPRSSKWCSASSLTVIEYSSDYQRLWSDCAYAQADLRLCLSHIPHCWKSHAAAQLFIKGLLWKCKHSILKVHSISREHTCYQGAHSDYSQ